MLFFCLFAKFNCLNFFFRLLDSLLFSCLVQVDCGREYRADRDMCPYLSRNLAFVTCLWVRGFVWRVVVVFSLLSVVFFSFFGCWPGWAIFVAGSYGTAKSQNLPNQYQIPAPPTLIQIVHVIASNTEPQNHPIRPATQPTPPQTPKPHSPKPSGPIPAPPHARSKPTRQSPKQPPSPHTQTPLP